MAVEDRLEELFMKDGNNRRVASVNMPPGPNPWRSVVAFAGVAAIVGIALIAVILGLREGQQVASPTATVVPSATATAASSGTPSVAPTATSSLYDSPLGYAVQLPNGWRRSDLQSHMTPKDNPDELAIEVFTTRTPMDEAEAMTHSDTGIGPAQMYTAFVGLYRNSRNETAVAYAERMKAGSGLVAVSIEPTTVSGRAGVKTTFKFTPTDPQSFYTVYVPDSDGMWVIGYILGSPIPSGATEPAVRSIVESFRFR
jgi:hypothetical protein